MQVHNAAAPAVVLFQAGLGLPASVWRPVIALLPDACALVVDRPGLAGCPPWDRAPGLADHVSLITDVLAACAPDSAGPVILVGHSYAGLIVEAFARTNPEQVTGLVLVDPSLPAHEVAARSLTERFPAAARALAGLGLRLSPRLGPQLGPRVGRWLGLAMAAGGTVGLGATGPTARDLAEAFADPDHRRATVDELLGIGAQSAELLALAAREPLGDIPVVIIAATRRGGWAPLPKRRWPRQLTDRAAELGAGAQVVPVAGAHLLMADAPAAIAAVIGDLVGRRPPGG